MSDRGRNGGAEGAAGEPRGPSLDLAHRVELAVRALAYLGVSLVLGVLGALAVIGVAVGAVLSVVWIGLPLLVAALIACARLADLDRRQANRLLDTHIAPVRRRRRAGTLWRRAVDALSNRRLWRILALLALKLPLAAVLLAVGLAPVALAAELLVLGVEGIGGVGAVAYVGPLALNAATGVLLCLLAVPAAVLAIAVLGALRSVLASITRALLAPPVAAEGGPVRELLAESLGDRSLSIVYWLPDRQVFVDEGGRPVAMPEPGSGRNWTAVERDGRRVAAIVHDAELDTGPELVNAAAAAAGLAIDNERLKADLRARVEELRVSRMRIVEAADAARRRLERDLHDGAQQQLVSLALDLRLLRARLGESEAAPLVDELSEKLGVALAELRELARGIHPAVLSDRGLGPAIGSLADRAPLPVAVDVALDERPSPPIEAAAYFVVAEALTNVVKYAKASGVRIAIRREGGDVVVAVDDDGVGGATLERGTGLRGLYDRIAALDGSLVVDSPPATGTRLRARIPWTAGLAAEAHEAGTDSGSGARALEPRS